MDRDTRSRRIRGLLLPFFKSISICSLAAILISPSFGHLWLCYDLRFLWIFVYTFVLARLSDLSDKFERIVQCATEYIYIKILLNMALEIERCSRLARNGQSERDTFAWYLRSKV